MFSFGIQSSEKLGNTGAENGIIHPWTMASSEVADAQLNTVETAQFNGSTVLPYSGNKFFLLDGSVTVKDGWGMASAYHQLYPLDSNTDLIDNGSVIFRLAGYLWLREDSCQVNVVPGIEFFDGNNQILYSATGQGSDFWKPNGGYNPMTFYGQVPPQARNFSVRIRVNFMEPEGTYPFALALDDISLTLYTDTESGIRPFVYVAEEFQLWQNSPNPFNSNTLIKYRLPASVAVRIEIFNALGQHVDTICDDFQGSGIHTVEWNADPLSSGIYFYVISADDFVKSRKCLLLK
jgi:hypothetical protein